MAFFKRVLLKLQNTRSKDIVNTIEKSFIGKYIKNIFHGITPSWRHDLFMDGFSSKYPNLKKSNLQYPPIAGFRSAHLQALTVYLRAHVTKSPQALDIKEFKYIEEVLLPECLEILIEEMFGVPEQFAEFYLHRCCIQTEDRESDVDVDLDVDPGYGKNLSLHIRNQLFWLSQIEF